MEKEKIISIINDFENAILSKKPWIPSLNNIKKLGKDIVPVIGEYFHKGGKSSDEELWVYLFQELKIKDYPTPSNEIGSWRNWSIKKYLECLEQYSRTEKEAEEYMKGFGEGNLSYNNSHHRSTAVRKYQLFMQEAEKLFDEEEIKKIKDKIHFLQAG